LRLHHVQSIAQSPAQVPIEKSELLNFILVSFDLSFSALLFLLLQALLFQLEAVFTACITAAFTASSI
jgi:hypothetical protein